MRSIDFIVFSALIEEYESSLRFLKLINSKTHSSQDLWPDSAILSEITHPERPNKSLLGIVASAESINSAETQNRSDSMGRLLSALVCQRMLFLYRPKVFFLTGKAGGFERNGVKLGDILISTEIIDYERQRIGSKTTEMRPIVQRINNPLVQNAINLQIATSGTPEDKRFKTLNCHAGPTLSGEKVVASLSMTNELLEHHPLALGIEMEGIGIAKALDMNDMLDRFCMIKGVSDLADDQKQVDSEYWSQFACDASTLHTFANLLSLAENGFFDE